MSSVADSDLQRQLTATTRMLAEFQIKYVDRGRRIEELEQQVAELIARAGRKCARAAVIERVTPGLEQHRGAWHGLRCDVCGMVFDGFHVLNAEGDRCCSRCSREHAGSGRTQGPAP